MPGSVLPIWGDQAGKTLRLDCRHYRGDRPCNVGVQGVCPSDCERHEPLGFRIVIIKLAALGDVIRTAALLPGLKQRWPASQITWVTRPNGVRMLAGHPLIDRLLPFDAETVCRLECERFDLCLSLDKEPAPAALAMRIDAKDRRGIGLSPYGTVYPLNRECGEYFQLGLSDELKFHHNQRSYQQLIYEAVGLRYEGQRYELYPRSASLTRAADFWRSAGVHPKETVIGLNTGAGNVFANKSWPAERFVELAGALSTRCGRRVALFGGPSEARTNESIASTAPNLIDTGCGHDEQDFAALLRRCNVLVTGDTMAMHAAIAQRVACIVLFGPTCAQEVDLYGRGERVVTPLSCSPCYLRSCDVSPNCMQSITVDRIADAVARWAAIPPDAPSPAPHSLVVLGSDA